MSNIKSGIIVLGVSFAVALGACTSKPLVNVTDTPVSVGKALTASQVRTAIDAAGVALGWQIKDLKPGLAQGTLQLREHMAVIEIPYSTTSYSIIYKSSANLGEKDGQIHKNYNSWVQNLDNGIKAQLSRM